MPYQVRRPVAAVAYELYLPKTAALQGGLYRALTAGADPAAVADRLRAHEDRIRQSLAADYPELAGDAADFRRRAADLAGRLNDLYTGYSVYEVDGVFLPPGGTPAEERTQVVRLTFEYRPPLADDWAANRERIAAVRAFVQSPVSAADLFARAYPALAADPADLAAAADWLHAAALFVHGYLLDAVGEAAEAAGQAQDEIWVVLHKTPLVAKHVPAGDP